MQTERTAHAIPIEPEIGAGQTERRDQTADENVESRARRTLSDLDQVGGVEVAGLGRELERTLQGWLAFSGVVVAEIRRRGAKG